MSCPYHKAHPEPTGNNIAIGQQCHKCEEVYQGTYKGPAECECLNCRVDRIEEKLGMKL